MQDFEQKRRVRYMKRKMYSWPILSILIILLLFAIQNVWSVGQKALETGVVAQEAQASLALLQEREEHLEKQVAELQEPFGIESQIREKYGYIKEGEEMVIVTDNRRAEALDAEFDDSDQSLWQRFINWF